MSKREDFLVEIHTEELPPKSILKMAEAFAQQIKERLQKSELAFDDVKFFGTPRRLAVLVTKLVDAQPDQVVERKGPALNAAFDANGNPSKACIGFANSCGVTPKELTTIKNNQGEWVGYKQHVKGKSIQELMPEMIEQAVSVLPVPKRMRWGDGDVQFTRPVHSVIMLYGDQVIEGKLLGFSAGRKTRGHRFHAPDWFDIENASSYEKQLEKHFVIADFAKRREKIQQDAVNVAKNVWISSSELLDEVTGLVEWPVALCGKFDAAFLSVPKEVLVSAMQDHQRYFPVLDDQAKLAPYFVTINNIQAHDLTRVTHGNERVLRARLSDAAFFFEADKKIKLEERIETLKGIVFQAKLGTLYEKAERLSKLAEFIAEKMGVDKTQAVRAGMLAKTDLTTSMVGEFPELQGVMGSYYAQHDGEDENVAVAMKEQYMPRFAGDNLPSNSIGQALALADRIDTLVGTFGINQIPTGDKDPYGLRRAALGVLRIVIENKLTIDVKELLEKSYQLYDGKLSVDTDTVVGGVHGYITGRMKVWCGDQGITPDVFSAVDANRMTKADLLEFFAAIEAVQEFKNDENLKALSIANKRVKNILDEKEGSIAEIDTALFDSPAEKELYDNVLAKYETVQNLYKQKRYKEILQSLSELRVPVDNFFDQVMVMTEDKAKQQNRKFLLHRLRNLFLNVADISLLQQ